MSVDFEVKIKPSDLRRLQRTLRRATPEIKKEIRKEWNVLMVDFRTLMQDKHLSGGTTEDRLARISSNLYNSLKFEIKLSGDDVNASIWFADLVKDYAPTHEFGDESRHIPPRINLQNEWDKYIPKFLGAANEAVNKGLHNA